MDLGEEKRKKKLSNTVAYWEKAESQKDYQEIKKKREEALKTELLRIETMRDLHRRQEELKIEALLDQAAVFTAQRRSGHNL